MTLAPSTPPAPVRSLGEAIDHLRASGLRVSTSRRLALTALFEAEQPISAQELAEKTYCDVASVYRNLETLEHVGLVRHCHLGHGPGLYELAGRPRRDYMVCESCGAVRAADPRVLAQLRGELLTKVGFEPRFDHFPLVGLCVDCRSSSSSRSRITSSPNRNASS